MLDPESRMAAIPGSRKIPAIPKATPFAPLEDCTPKSHKACDQQNLIPLHLSARSVLDGA